MKKSKPKQGTKAQRRAAHAERVYRARTRLKIQKPQKTRPISADAEGLISKIPKMALVDTLGIFNNSLRILASPEKRRLHRLAKRVLTVIEKEWTRQTRQRIDADGYFKWPSTEAPGGDGQLFAHGWPEEGLLGFMGYHVGYTNGVATPIRRELLIRVFAGQLPPFDSPSYMREWAQPGTALRLKKMADEIATFTRNAKRNRSVDLSNAIGDWEDDLRFLYEKYYVGHFHFAWPSTELPSLPKRGAPRPTA